MRYDERMHIVDISLTNVQPDFEKLGELASRGKAAGMVLWPPSAIVTRIAWDKNLSKRVNCVNCVNS